MHICNQNEEVSAYVDDELSPSARRGFETHIAQCSACREELARIRCLRDTLRGLPARTVGYDLAPTLRARYLWSPMAPKGRRGWHLPVLLPLSSALAATVFLGVYVGLVISTPVDHISSAKLALLDPVPACSTMVLF